MVNCNQCNYEFSSVWSCSCGCNFCQGCAKDWEYLSGYGQCPKCHQWVSYLKYSN